MTNNLTGRETVAVGVKGFAENADTADIAALSGELLLVSGVLASSAVAFIDFTLPSDFVRFTLQLQDLVFSVPDSLTMALSFDGGVSWLNDVTNFDSYQFGSVVQLGNPSGTFQPASSDGSLSLGETQWGTNPLGQEITVDIIPGGATFARVLYRAFGAGNPATTTSQALQFAAAWVNPYATVVPVPKRATNLRILPYGNGDVNPPTSGETITGGSYRLRGLN